MQYLTLLSSFLIKAAMGACKLEVDIVTNEFIIFNVFDTDSSLPCKDPYTFSAVTATFTDEVIEFPPEPQHTLQLKVAHKPLMLHHPQFSCADDSNTTSSFNMIPFPPRGSGPQLLDYSGRAKTVTVFSVEGGPGIALDVPRMGNDDSYKRQSSGVYELELVQLCPSTTTKTVTVYASELMETGMGCCGHYSYHVDFSASYLAVVDEAACSEKCSKFENCGGYTIFPNEQSCFICDGCDYMPVTGLGIGYRVVDQTNVLNPQVAQGRTYEVQTDTSTQCCGKLRITGHTANFATKDEISGEYINEHLCKDICDLTSGCSMFSHDDLYGRCLFCGEVCDPHSENPGYPTYVVSDTTTVTTSSAPLANKLTAYGTVMMIQNMACCSHNDFVLKVLVATDAGCDDYCSGYKNCAGYTYNKLTGDCLICDSCQFQPSAPGYWGYMVHDLWTLNNTVVPEGRVYQEDVTGSCCGKDNYSAISAITGVLEIRTAKDCANMCDLKFGCEGYGFDGEYCYFCDTCGTSQDGSTGYFVDTSAVAESTAAIETTTSVTTVYAHELLETGMGCCGHYSYALNFTTSYLPVRSMEDCSEKCSKFENCGGFTFFASSNTCYICEGCDLMPISAGAVGYKVVDQANVLLPKVAQGRTYELQPNKLVQCCGNLRITGHTPHYTITDKYSGELSLTKRTLCSEICDLTIGCLHYGYDIAFGRCLFCGEVCDPHSENAGYEGYVVVDTTTVTTSVAPPLNKLSTFGSVMMLLNTSCCSTPDYALKVPGMDLVGDCEDYCSTYQNCTGYLYHATTKDCLVCDSCNFQSIPPGYWGYMVHSLWVATHTELAEGRAYVEQADPQCCGKANYTSITRVRTLDECSNFCDLLHGCESYGFDGSNCYFCDTCGTVVDSVVTGYTVL